MLITFQTKSSQIIKKKKKNNFKLEAMVWPKGVYQQNINSKMTWQFWRNEDLSEGFKIFHIQLGALML